MFVLGKHLQPSHMFVIEARAYLEWSTWEVFPRVGSGLTLKKQTRLERAAGDKHSSLLWAFINYCRKKFYNIGAQVARLLTRFVWNPSDNKLASVAYLPLTWAGTSCWRGRLNTVDLLVLTSLEHLLLIVKILLSFYKTSYHNEEVNCTEPSP